MSFCQHVACSLSLYQANGGPDKLFSTLGHYVFAPAKRSTKKAAPSKADTIVHCAADHLRALKSTRGESFVHARRGVVGGEWLFKF